MNLNIRFIKKRCEVVYLYDCRHEQSYTKLFWGGIPHANLANHAKYTSLSLVCAIRQANASVMMRFRVIREIRVRLDYDWKKLRWKGFALSKRKYKIVPFLGSSVRTKNLLVQTATYA